MANSTSEAAVRTRPRPVRALVAALLRAAPQLTPRIEKLLWRGFYELASTGRRGLGTTLMNYGYAERDATETSASGAESFGLALYAATAGAVDLAGKDVLEVGCGRGGGTAFVFDRFRPRSMTGLDLAKKAVARCQALYARPGLAFVAGDAENLPFADGTFDALLSVESTHCYSDTPRFFAEASRVLRPRGLLLLADFRHAVLPPDAEDALVPQEDARRLREQLAAAGLQTLEEEDITENVVRALALDTPRRLAQIGRRVPRPLRRQAVAFAAVEGSPMYEAFAQGKWTYLRFVLQKS
jgi:SAM-dependent methyltransferase